MSFERNTAIDTIIYDTPATLYTDSTTLTSGMTLYDDTGTDTGYKVGTISGDSFDIQTNVSVNFVMGTGIVMGIASYTIDNVVYTSDQTVSLSIGAHTLSATPMDPYRSASSLLINNEQVGYDSCSFTVSDSQIVFGNNAYVGTPADSFVIELSPGSN